MIGPVVRSERPMDAASRPLRNSFVVAPHEGLARNVSTVRDFLGPGVDGSIRVDRVNPADLERIETGLVPHVRDAIARIANLLRPPWRGDRRSVAMPHLVRDFDFSK
jgi:hypothetical protein